MAACGIFNTNVDRSSCSTVSEKNDEVEKKQNQHEQGDFMKNYSHGGKKNLCYQKGHCR